MCDATSKLALCQLRLVQMTFIVVERAGIKHLVRKDLRRLETIGDDQTSLYDELPLLSVVNEERTIYAIAVHDRWSEKSLEDGPREMVSVITYPSKEPVEGDVPTAGERLQSQTLQTFCMQSAKLVGTPGTGFDVIQDGLWHDHPR